jgi:hypothetical protein
MKISFYYQEMATFATQGDDLAALIKMHVDTFSLYGWEPVRLDESFAKQHPLYDLFDDPTTIFATSKNNWQYTRACYMRWLAYAVAGYPFADFDVINYGFAVDDARNQRSMRDTTPILLSQACAAGLIDGEEYADIISVFLEFQTAPRIEGWTEIDVNDMNIILQYRPEWFRFMDRENLWLAREYTLPGWDSAKLVHYPYHYTPTPRSRTIQQVRAPVCVA